MKIKIKLKIKKSKSKKITALEQSSSGTLEPGKELYHDTKSPPEKTFFESIPGILSRR